MAENSTPEERTELPTDRRMGEIRRDGSLFVSTDTVQVLSLITGFVVLGKIWGGLLQDMRSVLVASLSMISDKEPLTVPRLHQGFVGLIALIGPDIFILTLLTAITASLAVMLQTKWNVKEKKINFKWTFVNPIAGIKRILSVHSVITTLKAIAKLCIILPIGFYALKAYAPTMLQLPFMSIEAITHFTGTAISTIFWKISYVLIAIAIFDYSWGKYKWLRDNKMTKDEVKDERKSIEGDETTKRKIIAKGLQRIAQRLMKTVPTADVIITNPTHFAVALKYDRNKMTAPMVVAKGQDYLALRIREIAKENKIPIIERKALARALYSSTRVGTEIPYELFKAVAEVLAYVFRLKNPASRKTAKTTENASQGGQI